MKQIIEKNGFETVPFGQKEIKLVQALQKLVAINYNNFLKENTYETK